MGQDHDVARAADLATVNFVQSHGDRRRPDIRHADERRDQCADRPPGGISRRLSTLAAASSRPRNAIAIQLQRLERGCATRRTRAYADRRPSVDDLRTRHRARRLTGPNNGDVNDLTHNPAGPAGLNIGHRRRGVPTTPPASFVSVAAYSSRRCRNPRACCLAWSRGIGLALAETANSR